MIPIDFPQANRTLTAPSSMTDEECGPLRVWTIGEECISLWRGGLLERLRFLVTGRMWLRVASGRTQPPVALQVECPWRR